MMIGTDEHELNLFGPWLRIVSEMGQSIPIPMLARQLGKMVLYFL